MFDVDLILKEFKFFNAWEAQIRATLDAWGLTEEAIKGVKALPETASEIQSLVDQVRTIRARVDYLKARVPPIVTSEDQWDVMRAGDDGLWHQYTIPTAPEV